MNEHRRIWLAHAPRDGKSHQCDPIVIGDAFGDEYAEGQRLAWEGFGWTITGPYMLAAALEAEVADIGLRVEAIDRAVDELLALRLLRERLEAATGREPSEEGP
jgi:hypothetical protein